MSKARQRLVALVGAVSLMAALAGCANASEILKVENQTDPLSHEGVKASGVLYWLSSETDFSQMPDDGMGTTDECSAGMTQWLAENGDRITSPQKVRLTNMSKEQQVVTLTNERSSSDVTEESQPPRPGLVFQCGTLGLAEKPVDGEIAWHDVVYNLTTGSNADATTENQTAPFSVALPPGGTVGLFIVLAGEQPFSGQLQAATDAGGASPQGIPIMSKESPESSFDWPGVDSEASLLAYIKDDEIYCSIGRPSFADSPCSPVQMANLIREMDLHSRETRIPPEVSGEWCTVSQSECFNLSSKKIQYPGLFVEQLSGGSSGPGWGFKICLEGDLDRIVDGQIQRGCSMAASIFIDYFPVGSSWECVSQLGQGGWPSCDPDYTNDHDVARERIVIRPGHQQDEVYHDSPPMYRVDG